MTPVEAFQLAIDLAVTAATNEKAAQATQLAEDIAKMLTPEQVKSVLEMMEA